MYAAVKSSCDYVVARAKDGRRFVLAKDLLEPIGKKIAIAGIEREMKGADLVGLRYRPPFDLFQQQATGWTGGPIWTVLNADFVSLDAGTGVVHLAPAFGEDDHDAHRKLLSKYPSLPLFCAVKPDGTFVDEFERYAGRWVKDCDKEIQHDLRDRDLLVHAEQYRHEYPFCWRAEGDPLIQYARPAWYIATTRHIDRAIANNRAVNWLPEHIREGRFGDFLANNVDWALSRERWWGTPLNVWICDRNAEHKEVPSSVAAILERNRRAFDHFHAARSADPSLSEHLIVHKPWIDQVTFPCNECGGTMRRVPEVIDCWFDSGCMPFAQWGYPHQGIHRFEHGFPADFISEGIDQTRGWFYSLLMVSTLVFDGASLLAERPLPHPYKTCMVLGHVLDREGKKESKSKGNYTPPEIILDRVAMDFAVLDAPDAKKGVARIGREDLEGLDLQVGARVRLYRADAQDRPLYMIVEIDRRLRRRVVVVHPDDRASLGVLPTSATDVLPMGVPRLPPEERVTIEDPSAPAPGADAFRWFFYAANPPWSGTRHSLANVRALQKEFAVKLRNVYSFFTIYGNIDGFDPDRGAERETTKRPELDRWICSELAITARAVTDALDAYDVYGATQKLTSFVDGLSNWYVRRSRARFWRSGWDEDKKSAYETLYATLVSLCKLTAPFTPYAAEAMWQNLVVRPARRAAKQVPESVHLADWADADLLAIDERLSEKVETIRALVSLGLQVRTDARIKVRQPLRTARIITVNPDLIDASAASQLKEELNVLSDVESYGIANADRYVEFRIKPSFRSLGQRGLGREAQRLKHTMAAFSSAEAGALASALMAGAVTDLLGVDLRRDDVEVEFVAKEGFAAAGDRAGVVVLDTRIDDELRDRGFLRELQNRIQTIRKEMALQYTDRIRLWIRGTEHAQRIVEEYKEALAAEVLAVEVSTGAAPSAVHVRDVDVDGEPVHLGLVRVGT
jgi:isoleucyl-tRNA synthetase